jgi:DNA-binding transcriptional ArsR family regulator
MLSRKLARDETEQPAVSQQLRVLRHLGLVVGERDGRRVIYGTLACAAVSATCPAARGIRPPR